MEETIQNINEEVLKQFEFDDEFEQQALAFLVLDIDFFKRNSQWMKAGYFVSDAREDIYRLASQYMDKYNEVISQEALRNEITAMYTAKKKKNVPIDMYFDLLTDLYARKVESGGEYIEKKLLDHAKCQEKVSLVKRMEEDLIAGKNPTHIKVGTDKEGKAILVPLSERFKQIDEIGVTQNNILESLPTFNDIDENAPEDWLVEDLLPRCAITAFYGKRGLGKSHLIYLVAKCVESNTDFFGHKVKQCPVYYIDYENPLGVRAHIKKICGGSNVKMWALDNKKGPPPRLDSKEWEIFKTFPPGLIIFDTFRASHQKNTQDDTDMTFIMNRLKELWAKGFTVVILLHTLKLDDKMWKGNTVILDLSDHTLALFKVKNPGAVKEDEDEDEDDAVDLNKPKLLYFGGVADEKTRYRKYNTYIWFDPEKGISIMDDPDLPLLNKAWESFNDWVSNETKKGASGYSGAKGYSGWQVKFDHYELEAKDYPNRDEFETLIAGWLKCKPNQAEKLIPKGLKLGFWNKDELKIGKQRRHYYYPLILKSQKQNPSESVNFTNSAGKTESV